MTSAGDIDVLLDPRLGDQEGVLFGANKRERKVGRKEKKEIFLTC